MDHSAPRQACKLDAREGGAANAPALRGGLRAAIRPRAWASVLALALAAALPALAAPGTTAGAATPVARLPPAVAVAAPVSAPACPPPATAPASAPASAPAATPAAVAEALLRAHFCNGLALDAAAVQAQSDWLTADLRRRLLDWLARPQNPDEVPDLNGDPWTDSQEYPTRFAVQAAVLRGDRAEVPVSFVLAPRRWQVTMLMRREDGRWRVADLRYRHGERLTQLLH